MKIINFDFTKVIIEQFIISISFKYLIINYIYFNDFTNHEYFFTIFENFISFKHFINYKNAINVINLKLIIKINLIKLISFTQFINFKLFYVKL